ncbi:hypothetical protein D1872_266340 [compost metagenome]
MFIGLPFERDVFKDFDRIRRHDPYLFVTDHICQASIRITVMLSITSAYAYIFYLFALLPIAGKLNDSAQLAIQLGIRGQRAFAVHFHFGFGFRPGVPQQFRTTRLALNLLIVHRNQIDGFAALIFLAVANAKTRDILFYLAVPFVHHRLVANKTSMTYR